MSQLNSAFPQSTGVPDYNADGGGGATGHSGTSLPPPIETQPAVLAHPVRSTDYRPISINGTKSQDRESSPLRALGAVPPYLTPVTSGGRCGYPYRLGSWALPTLPSTAPPTRPCQSTSNVSCAGYPLASLTLDLCPRLLRSTRSWSTPSHTSSSPRTTGSPFRKKNKPAALDLVNSAIQVHRSSHYNSRGGEDESAWYPVVRRLLSVVDDS